MSSLSVVGYHGGFYRIQNKHADMLKVKILRSQSAVHEELHLTLMPSEKNMDLFHVVSDDGVFDTWDDDHPVITLYHNLNASKRQTFSKRCDAGTKAFMLVSESTKMPICVSGRYLGFEGEPVFFYDDDNDDEKNNEKNDDSWTTVRALSWNLDGFPVGKNRPYADRLREAFKTDDWHTQFDLIATMETSEKNFKSMMKVVGPRGFDGHYCPKQGDNLYEQGQAILWRTSIFNESTRICSDLPAKGAGVFVVLGNKGSNKKLIVQACHMKSWPTGGDNFQWLRTDQWESSVETIYNLIADTEKPPTVLIMGDFNENIQAAGDKSNIPVLTKKLSLRRVFKDKDHTRKSTMTDQRWLVDYALLSADDTRIDNVWRTGLSENDFHRSVSDHYPLRFTFSYRT